MAAQSGKRVLIINRDATRGDRHAVARVDLPLGAALTTPADELGICLDDETKPVA